MPASRLSALDPGRPGLPSLLGRPHARDLFIAPHSDDVCFSLGALIAARGAGTLLTVFSVSSYLADTRAARSVGLIGTTARRMAEDAAFASETGLLARWLGLPDAPVRGEAPFEPGPIDAVVRDLRSRLLAALVGPTLGLRNALRPWLLCPMGIGGHRDHRAVQAVVLEARAMLSVHFRIGFYEDLYYAADPVARRRAIDSMAARAPDLPLVRCRYDLDPAAADRKRALLSLYASQTTLEERSLARFSPALPAVPHEAIWALQSDITQASG